MPFWSSSFWGVDGFLPPLFHSSRFTASGSLIANSSSNRSVFHRVTANHGEKALQRILHHNTQRAHADNGSMSRSLSTPAPLALHLFRFVVPLLDRRVRGARSGRPMT